MIPLDVDNTGTIVAALITSVITTVGLVVVAVLQLRNGRKITETNATAQRSVETAQRAVELSEPTSNGFAKHVREQLQQIRETQATDRAETRADIRALREDISDLRDGQRSNTSRLNLVEMIKHRGESV